jgi:hypothetical protein
MAQSDTAFLRVILAFQLLLCSHRNSMHIPRKTSWGTPIPPSSSQKDPTDPAEKDFDDVDLHANEKVIHE